MHRHRDSVTPKGPPPQEASSGGAGIAMRAAEDVAPKPARVEALSARSGLAADTPPMIYKRFMLEHLAQTFGGDCSSWTGRTDETESKKGPNRPRQDETLHLQTVRKELRALATEHRCDVSFFSSTTDKFLPDVDLWRYMDQPKVRAILDQCGLDDASDGKKDWLAYKICSKPQSKTDVEFKSYRKILAILIRIQKQEQIGRFVDEELHDSLLPLEQVEGPGGCLQLVLDERSGPHPCFADWGPDEIEIFVWRQWEMCAPFFKTDKDDLRHYIFPGGIAIPLIPTDEGQMEGGGGCVAVVQLPESHGSLRTLQTGERKQLFAVKKLKSSHRSAFEAEAHALGRLNKIRKRHEQETSQKTRHISMMAATFEIGSKSMPRFYLVFPCADGNLREFWNAHSTPRSSQHVYSLSRWMARQMHGLTGALAILHEFYTYKPKDDNDPCTRGIHGDIKPENILRFTDWGGVDESQQHGVLQLADFGTAKYHHMATVNYVDPNLRKHAYCAPEVDCGWTTNQSLDTWALGCLFFEFCLWVVFGNEGLLAFDASRKVENVNGDIESGPFYEIHEQDPSECWPVGRIYKKMTIHTSVIEWAKKMHELPWVPKCIHDLVDMVLTDILILRNVEAGEKTSSPTRPAATQRYRTRLPRVPPSIKGLWELDLFKKRISVSELYEKLGDMVNQDEAYFTQGFQYDMATFKTARPFRYLR